MPMERIRASRWPKATKRPPSASLQYIARLVANNAMTHERHDGDEPLVQVSKVTPADQRWNAPTGQTKWQVKGYAFIGDTREPREWIVTRTRDGLQIGRVQ